MLIKLEKKSPQDLVRTTGVTESDGIGLRVSEILVVIKNCNSEFLSY